MQKLKDLVAKIADADLKKEIEAELIKVENEDKKRQQAVEYIRYCHLTPLVRSDLKKILDDSKF